jgi:hypothetical protein
MEFNTITGWWEEMDKEVDSWLTENTPERDQNNFREFGSREKSSD